MQLVDTPIKLEELIEPSKKMYGLVKAVVDIEKAMMVIDAPMHADEEKYLLDMGSLQDNLWGINLYPEVEGDDFVEFDSMINIRPRLNNMTRSVENPDIQKKIREIVNSLIIK
jgi:hypothetical protein